MLILIEAGPDTAPGEVPEDIRSIFPIAYANRNYFWPLTTTFRNGEAPVPFLQPRVMGGGSSVMGMIALRGLPHDYQRWEQMGARNWGWRDVLPTFQAMTNDLDEPAPQRNARGPNVVRRLPREVWPLYMRRLEAGGESARRGVARKYLCHRRRRFLPDAAEPRPRARHQRPMLSDQGGEGASQPHDHDRHARACASPSTARASPAW